MNEPRTTSRRQFCSLYTFFTSYYRHLSYSHKVPHQANTSYGYCNIRTIFNIFSRRFLRHRKNIIRYFIKLNSKLLFFFDDIWKEKKTRQRLFLLSTRAIIYELMSGLCAPSTKEKKRKKENYNFNEGGNDEYVGAVAKPLPRTLTIFMRFHEYHRRSEYRTANRFRRIIIGAQLLIYIQR